jgi:hypothetical protein
MLSVKMLIRIDRRMDEVLDTLLTQMTCGQIPYLRRGLELYSDFNDLNLIVFKEISNDS